MTRPHPFGYFFFFLVGLAGANVIFVGIPTMGMMIGLIVFLGVVMGLLLGGETPVRLSHGSQKRVKSGGEPATGT